MLCRVADSLFWMSRYLERAENQARFIDVTLNIALGYRGSEENLWSSLIHAGGDVDVFEKHYSVPSRQNVLRYLLFDRNNLNSVVNCLAFARENARSIRENLTSSLWEAINRFYLKVRSSAADADRVLNQPHPFLEQIKRLAHQVSGVASATWSHGEAWNFSSMGTLLERADKTSRILDVKYFVLLPTPTQIGSQVDVVQWAALLESTSALQTYRRTHGRIVPVNVVDFLILNPSFPRSLRFCVHEADTCLRAISGSLLHENRNAAEEQLGELNQDLDQASGKEIVANGLHQFVDDFQSRLNHIGMAISDTFFQVRIPPQSGSRSLSQSQSPAVALS
ncbi:MAG: alpha-E domain-containing protein [Planctomycetota bacterium]